MIKLSIIHGANRDYLLMEEHHGVERVIMMVPTSDVYKVLFDIYLEVLLVFSCIGDGYL